MVLKCFKSNFNNHEKAFLSISQRIIIDVVFSFSFFRASVSGHMGVIYVRILLPYAEKFDPGRMT